MPFHPDRPREERPSETMLRVMVQKTGGIYKKERSGHSSPITRQEVQPRYFKDPKPSDDLFAAHARQMREATIRDPQQ